MGKTACGSQFCLGLGLGLDLDLWFCLGLDLGFGLDLGLGFGFGFGGESCWESGGEPAWRMDETVS